MKRILILASNPRKDLNLDREVRDLREVIEKSRFREQFEVEDALAVRVTDLQDLLLKHQPQIVHFCGHGSGKEGLVFENDEGGEQWVQTDALSNLFKISRISSQVECVLLNACYSEEQANAIVNHINYVIGMNQEIRDDAAIAFSKGFYRALGYECSIEQAFEFGRNAIQLEISGNSKMRSGTTDEMRKIEVVDSIQHTPIPEHLMPILKKKPSLAYAPNPLLPEEVRTAIQLDIEGATHQESVNVDVRKLSMVSSESESNLKNVKQGRFIIVVIGINKYKNWTRLNNAVKDATGFQQTLVERLGFIQILDPLLNEKATKRAIDSLVSDDLPKHLKEDDNLILFFAGHGHTKLFKLGDEYVSEVGYLVPVEARYPEYWSDFIEMGPFLENVGRLPAKHIVVILDACHSGFALGNAIKTSRGTPKRYHDDLCKHRSRKVITSARRDQDAQDNGPIVGHSLFTGTLIKGIEENKVDIYNEGCLTSTGLGFFIQQAVGSASESRQTPDFGCFAYDDRGEMVIWSGLSVDIDKSMEADPKVKQYRDRVRSYLADRIFTKDEQIRLKQLQIQLGLSQLEADRILEEEQAPIDTSRKKYRNLLIELIARGRDPFDPTIQDELKLCQQEEKLTDGEVEEISSSILETAKLKQQWFEFEVVTITAIDKGLWGLGTPKVQLNRRRGRREYRVEELGNGVTLDLVAIPGGKFLMGSPDSEEERSDNEGPQHEVTVSPFWMGKYQVTQFQWRAVATLPKIKTDLKSEPSKFKGDNRPVEQISWEEAIEFCARLSKKTGREYRLPSEAEWEYACRAGTTTPFYFGKTITPELANYDGNYTYASGPKGQYREETTEVGSFPPNAFGLYDMHGNVWEWCLDHWHDSYKGAPSDGSPWVTGGNDGYRVLRGGSWVNLPSNCRSAIRDWNFPGFGYDNFGFRVVCSSAWT